MFVIITQETHIPALFIAHAHLPFTTLIMVPYLTTGSWRSESEYHIIAIILKIILWRTIGQRKLFLGSRHEDVVIFYKLPSFYVDNVWSLSYVSAIVDDSFCQQVIIAFRLSARSVEQDVAIQQFHVIVIAWLQNLFSLSVHYRHLSIRQLDDGKLPFAIYKLTIL